MNQYLAAMKKSFETLDIYGLHNSEEICPVCEAMTTLRTAIAEMEKAEPVAYVVASYKKTSRLLDKFLPVGTKLYLHPQQQTIPEGWQLVPKDIHPLYRKDCVAVMELMRNPPPCPKHFEEQDYYDMWWGMVLAAAPKLGDS